MDKNDSQGGSRNSKTDPFKKYYEKGHDHTKAFIEEKDKDGNVTKRAPKGTSLSLFDLTDEEIGDYISPQELKKMREIQKTRKLNKDECKEKQEEKDNLIKQQQKEIDSLKDIIYQHNELLKKISERLK